MEQRAERDDAKIVSSVSNILLTGRNLGTGNRVPLAGVPYHALDTYLAKLVQAAHKVAIVEQTGNQQKAAGIPGRILETRGDFPILEMPVEKYRSFSPLVVRHRFLCDVLDTMIAQGRCSINHHAGVL
jgi:hypothetical protein